MEKERNKPDIHFIGLGAFKAATTFISKVLEEHPETCVAIGKEANYFNKHFGKGPKNPNFEKPLSWYAKYFVHAQEGQKLGEISPIYLFDAYAPERIFHTYPNVKFIVCLRDPVERAFSHFIMEKYTHASNNYSDFREAMENNYVYMKAGLYYEQLSRYLEYFPLSQFHFIFAEDLKNKEQETISGLYKFLELKDADFIPKKDAKATAFRKVRFVPLDRIFASMMKIQEWCLRNGLDTGVISQLEKSVIVRWLKKLRGLNSNTKKYPALSNEDRQWALQFYLEDIEKLEKLLDRDLSHWKK